LGANFHRGIVFATSRSSVALGSMIKSLLCRQHVGRLALPNLQSRLLDFRTENASLMGIDHEQPMRVFRIRSGRDRL
jgi:hypothetical protein